MTEHTSSSSQAGPSTSASIQFDEASLSRGKGGRTRVQSSAANSSASTVPANDNATLAKRPGGTASSIAGSVNGSIASRQPQPQSHRRKVVTKPAWAQMDDDDDDEGDAAQNQGPSTSSAAAASGSRDKNATLPSSWAPTSDPSAADQGTASASDNTDKQKAPPKPADEDDDELKGPARFWTFTLPTKYRNRLHEHHLRMLRNEMVERDTARRRVRRQSRDSDRRSSSSRSSQGTSSSDSDDSSQIIVQGLSGAIPNATEKSQSQRNKPRSRQQQRGRRNSGGGLGDAFASAGAAAGLGGQDSVIGWRRRQQEQRHNSSSGADTEKQAPPQTDTSPDQSSSGQRDDGDRNMDEETARSQDPNVLALPATEMRAKIPLHSSSDHSLTRHQANTPGWESPWHPEEMTGVGAIDVGGYTFATGGTGDGFFPRTDTRRSGASGRGRKRRFGGKQNGTVGHQRTRNGMSSLSEKGASSSAAKQLSGDGWWADKWAWWKEFLMRNPFVPLLFRAINFSFTTATLAVAIVLWRILHEEGAADSVGASPLVGIIFAPLSLIHVGAQVWLEYFSRPIGLWAVKSKLSYQLIELVFISLWSAELALTFDNYATSSLVCVSWYSPCAESSSSTRSGCAAADASSESPLNNPSRKPYICSLQAALIGLTFTTLVAYVAVFSVSLFRTVVR